MGGWEAPWHWIVLAIVVIALFGYKKMPDAARSVGRSLRIFKTEIKGMNEDDKKRAETAAEPSAPTTPKQIENPAPGATSPVQTAAPVPQPTPAHVPGAAPGAVTGEAAAATAAPAASVPPAPEAASTRPSADL